jgi:hypothetical protein
MNYISFISCIILLHVELYGSLSKMLQTKVDISNCCSLCTNRSKTHLRESVISKIFPGVIPPDPRFQGEGKEGGRKGRGWEGEKGRDRKKDRGRGEGKGDGKGVRGGGGEGKEGREKEEREGRGRLAPLGISWVRHCNLGTRLQLSVL